MHDVMLSLLAYVLVPVSTAAALLLLMPLGQWSHRIIASIRMPQTVLKFTYSKELMCISFGLFAFYAICVFSLTEEEMPLGTLQGPSYNTLNRWKLERNFHLSLFLAMNLL